MHPNNCPAWEYENVLYYSTILQTTIADQVKRLRERKLDSLAVTTNSRGFHGPVFVQLTPREQRYYAGHYRGENFPCLLHYKVEVSGDPRVGTAPSGVKRAMGELGMAIRSGLAALDKLHKRPETEVPAVEKLLATVKFACRVLEVFLRIHPYANGNGHTGRFIVWAVLGRYGYWPE